MSRTASNGHHIFLSCGEASGERYAAALATALRRRDPRLRLSALGGSLLAESGVEVVQRYDEIAIMGFAEVVSALPALWRARRAVWSHLSSADVDLCICIDFPGFNLKVAGRAKKLGIPVLYVIPPQLWAWGRWRLRALRRNVDRVGTILPFETGFYGDNGIDAIALGHPLMEDYGPYPFEEIVEARERRILDTDAPLTVGLLPGSRRQEVTRLMPRLRIAARIFRSWLAPRSISFVMSEAPGIDLAKVAGLPAERFDLTAEPLKELLGRIDLALVCSGTASLEAGLAGVPHEIVYATSAFNFWIARQLVKVKHIGLANLITGREMVREHVQAAANPLGLARGLASWLTLPQTRRDFYDQARQLRGLCGETGVWERAAEAALAMLGEGRRRD
jgi:lipid-A-disaccharide synthase